MKKKKMLSIMMYTFFIIALIPLSSATIINKDDTKQLYNLKQGDLRVASAIVIGIIHGGYNEQSKTIDADLIYVFSTFANRDLRGFYRGELKIDYCGILTEKFICARCCIYPGGW